MEFIEKKAKELFVCSSGLSKSGDQFGYGYPFLSYSEIFNNYYIPDELLTLVNSTEKDRIKCSIQRGDVFLTRTSETTDELGMSCVALKDYPNATFNGFAKRLRPITDEILPEYAAYFFRSYYFRAQCMSMASLITRASLNDGMIERLKIRYPESKKIQSIIAFFLMRYDRLIKLNNRRIETLEQMADNLYKEWFVRFRFPGHENTEFENGIPKGWELKRIGDLVQLKSGYAFKSEWWIEEGVPVIKIKDIESNTINLSDLSFVSKVHAEKSKLFFVNPGDLLIALTGATIGKIGLVPYCKNILTVNQRVGKFFLGKTPCESVAFWFCMFQQTHIQEHIIAIASSNAAQPNISPFDIERIRIPYNKDVVDKFNKKVQPFVEQILDIRRINHNLVKQRDLLLPRLMSGKLEV